MSIKEIADLITSKGYFFEVALPGKSFPLKSVDAVLAEYASVEDYLYNLAQKNHADQLGITLSSKNGSSHKKRGFYLVQLGAVATVEPAVATAPCALHGTSPQSMNQPMDAPSEILRVRLEFAEQKSSDLERRNKDLERKNDDLYNENLRLLRENLIQKDKLELEFKQKELELAGEKQTGLNGIMEQVKSLPPEGWQFIAGLFPNHPMAKLAEQSGNAPTELLEGTKKHPDADANTCIEMLSELLLNQGAETVGMVSMVAQALTTRPEALKQLYLQFYPQTNQQ